MAKFLIRIELHSASQDDYSILHSLMEKAGFSRIIKGDNGSKYHLPLAEYYLEGSYTADKVLNAAKNTANATGHSSAVLVGDCTRLMWNGLAIVK